MAGDFKAGFLPINMGSLPHTDPDQALSLVQKHLPEVSAWPQLPKRSFLESMYVQFSERFPGIVLEGERIYVDRTRDLSKDLERLYLAYLESDLDEYAVSPAYAAGLARWLKGDFHACRAVKGQLTGPISWGLSVTDQEARPVVYDEVLADAVAKHLRLKAAWQEQELRRLHPKTMIFVDEPYLAAFGSAYIPISREQVIALIEEVLDGLAGLKGIHCCGNTDWSLVLSTSIDLLSFDAYNYAETLALYPAEVQDFLRRGGIIVWGIVPRETQQLDGETGMSLVERLQRAMGLLTSKGVALDDLLAASLVSPSCGLGPASLAGAERALALAAAVSREMRTKYLLS